MSQKTFETYYMKLNEYKFYIKIVHLNQSVTLYLIIFLLKLFGVVSVFQMLKFIVCKQDMADAQYNVIIYNFVVDRF